MDGLPLSAHNGCYRRARTPRKGHHAVTAQEIPLLGGNTSTVVRVGEEAEQGLDEAMHGESAYEDAPLVTGSAAPAL